ncbi:MAG: polysaccharide export protein [Rhodobacteraceae bacterium]|nr:MAG: polysaccharide export protein [Paracoccaceae bacterium]
MRFSIRVATATALVVSMSGCAMLPGSGPREQRINANALATSRNTNATLGYDYVVVDVTRATLPFMSRDTEGEFRTFGATTRAAPSIRLGPGDVVRVTVFESQTGGLFLPEDAGARPGNFVQLPPQRIDQDGRITVPFAGVVQAAGQTPATVERIIRDRLLDRAIEPEISVEIVEQNFSRVSVVGDVRGPGVLPLREGGLRILEAIAQAGGISTPASSTFVVLKRDGRSAKVAYRSITENPRENVFLAPGDTIEILEEDKEFFAFGATGLVGNFKFGAEDVSLNEAVARFFSLQDNVADPRHVLIYRKESRYALEKMGVDLSEVAAYGHEFHTIFRADYRSPDIFFMANEFQMRDGDVIYVTNAASIEFQRFFNNATSLTGSPLAVRDNIESF